MSSIFLSHSHKDREFARRLARQLEELGIRVWVAEAEILVGDSLIAKIESGIRDMDYLGVVLSKHSVSSEWVRREVGIALTEEIQGQRVKVLPLLMERCEAPGFLVDKLYADFTDDFENGLLALVSRLKSDQHWHTKRSYEMLSSEYREWIASGRRIEGLLGHGALISIVKNLADLALTADHLEYVFLSAAGLRDPVLGPKQIQDWLGRVEEAQRIEICTRLLKNPDPSVRREAMPLLESLDSGTSIAILLEALGGEGDAKIKQMLVAKLYVRGGRLPKEAAKQIVLTEEDWILQSYALRRSEEEQPRLLEEQSCLLVSDSTDFAEGLGELAKEVGFLVVRHTPFVGDLSQIKDELLEVYDLLILVRGEQFTDGQQAAYDVIRRYVTKGGQLFATAWVGWETKHDPSFANILPFRHLQESYNEDVEVTCHATEGVLASQLFKGAVKFRSSFEILEENPGSIVLWESENRVPMFGYRLVENGICYYLNSCQHACAGVMVSPLVASPAVRDRIHAVLRWIHTGIAARM